MSDVHAADAAGDGNPPPIDNDVEARARLMGWKPQNEFKGDPARWTDAETFVERGEKILPIVLERNRALEDKFTKQGNELGEVKTRLNEIGQAFEEYRDFARRSEERAYSRAKADLEARMTQAVETADRAAFQTARAELEALNPPPPAARPADETTRQSPPAPKIEPYVQEWIAENEWFNRSPAMNAYATALHGQLLQDKPGMSLRENLAEVRKEVIARFPEKFGNPKREGAPSVAAPTATPRRGRTEKKTYDDLPQDAKAACDKYVTMINASKPKVPYTREEYVRIYFAGEE